MKLFGIFLLIINTTALVWNITRNDAVFSAIAAAGVVFSIFIVVHES